MSTRLVGWLFVILGAVVGIEIVSRATAAVFLGGLILYTAGLIAGILIAHPAQTQGGTNHASK